MVGIEQSLEAQKHIWSYLSRFISSLSLKCAVDLRIPDAIHKHGGNPVTLSQLAADLGIPHSKKPFLRRLMLSLINFGFFRLTVQKGVVLDGGSHDGEEEAYLLTDSSLFLLTDTGSGQHSLAACVRVAIDPWFVTPLQSLSSWFHTADSPTPFYLAHGQSIWELANQVPEINAMLIEMMASDSHLTADAVIEKHGEALFKGLTSLVDVGGGNGATAMAIAQAFPQLSCSVLELPHVVATIPKSSRDIIEFVAGDMFEQIPPADAILLKCVLHDWGDEGCIKLLKLCKGAVPTKDKGGKVIIIDMVMSSDLPHELSRTHHNFDMMMMVLNHEGRERSEKEWQKLFNDAGFSDYKILSGLGLRNIIELYH